MRLFDPQAPMTVRIGAGLMVVGVVLAFMREVSARWLSGGPQPGIWVGLIAPILGLTDGVIWARGIGQMIGIYYWCWVALVSALILMFAVLLPLSWTGQITPVRWKPWTPLSTLEGACAIGSAVLLLVKPSIGAFWKRGLSSAKSPHVV